MIHFRNAGIPDDPNRWKPPSMRDHLLVHEIANLVNRDVTRIYQLEAKGKIPKPARVKVGRLRVRLYSPEEVAVILDYFANARPGRPPVDGRPAKIRHKRRVRRRRSP